MYMKEQGWVTEETKLANFGDKRLNRRYSALLSNFEKSPDKSITSSCKGWAETLSAYRFMNNTKVTDKEILEPHKCATIERIKREKVVLLPQDTTEVDFTGRKMTGMGYLGSENSQGLYLHPSIAVTPERLCLGVIDNQSWTRKELGSKKLRKQKPIEEKETYCWLKGYEAANQVAQAAPDTVIVSVADREGDIYEFLEKQPSEINKAYWLIRARHNRSLNNEQFLNQTKMFEKVKSTTPIGTIEFNLPEAYVNRNSSKKYFRKARTVIQEIRTCCLTLKPPINKKTSFDKVTVYAVHCLELNPPEGEKAIEWLLLTSYPVNDEKTAIEIIEWYLCRWQIEVFFKVLKSGCRVEELQFETYRATINILTFYMIVAWRIMYVTMIGRHCPDIDCSVVFEKSEWQSVYAIEKKAIPKDAPKLKDMIYMIAKLGGFLGRKYDGEPGPKVMWIGMQKMKDYTISWEACMALANTYV